MQSHPNNILESTGDFESNPIFEYESIKIAYGNCECDAVSKQHGDVVTVSVANFICNSKPKPK